MFLLMGIWGIQASVYYLKLIVFLQLTHVDRQQPNFLKTHPVHDVSIFISIL